MMYRDSQLDPTQQQGHKATPVFSVNVQFAYERWTPQRPLYLACPTQTQLQPARGPAFRVLPHSRTGTVMGGCGSATGMFIAGCSIDQLGDECGGYGIWDEVLTVALARSNFPPTPSASCIQVYGVKEGKLSCTKDASPDTDRSPSNVFWGKSLVCESITTVGNPLMPRSFTPASSPFTFRAETPA